MAKIIERRKLRQHHGCGGGLVQSPAPGDGRPMFTCTKCGASFTNGRSGEPWAAVVPFVRTPNPQQEGW